MLIFLIAGQNIADDEYENGRQTFIKHKFKNMLEYYVFYCMFKSAKVYKPSSFLVAVSLKKENHPLNRENFILY